MSSGLKSVEAMTRTELIDEWESRPPREKAGPETFDRMTKVRGMLFGSYMRCPDSPVGGQKKAKKD
jgi:hypothetical protein